jgi:hypothetical protein
VTVAARAAHRYLYLTLPWRVPPLLAVYFLIADLSLFVLAFLLSREEPHSPELRCIVVIMGVVS